MDFSLTTEQQELRDVIRSAVRTLASDEILIAQREKPTGFMPNAWDQLARAGWMSLGIPEELGGSGATVSDVAVMMEELGRAPVPQIFIVAMTLSPSLIQEVGTPEQHQELLPLVAEGAERITVAITEPDHGWTADHVQATLAGTGDGLRLNGVKTFVPDPLGATRVLVAVRLEGSDRIALVVVDPNADGVSWRPLAGMVSWQSEMTLSDVAVDESAVLGGLDQDAWPGIERAMLSTIPLVCAYQVGSCQSVFDLSIEHSRTRIQFGQPIGRFQRVQDHIVEIVNDLDAARWSTYEAIWKLETDPAGAAASVHMAKSIVAESHWDACNFGHEVHAGLGVDFQYGLAKHTYLSRTLFHFLGEPRWHRQRMTEALDW